MHWTGTKCCVEGAYQCVAGNSGDCSQVGSWTGSTCCVVWQTCFGGDESPAQCYNSNGHWTGSDCCF
jgi:hypothetical protein